MTYVRMLVAISIALFAGLALGQVAASPAPVAVVSGPSGLISWIVGHSAILSGVVVAILDLVFALNPNANAPDGVLHMVYMWLQKLSGKAPSQ